MNVPAKTNFAAPRHAQSPWLAFKRAVKNALFPLPGVRKFLIALHQRVAEKMHAENDNALFNATIQPGKPRAIVISIPKSGTYLLHGLLKQLGLISAGVHLGESGFYDQRFEKEARDDFGEMKIDRPLSIAATQVGEGQVAAGHLLYLKANVKALKDFRIFFTYREARAVFVSYMRYFFKPGHGDEYGLAWKSISDEKQRMAEFMRLYGPAHVIAHRDIAGWMNYPHALPVKFETLCGDEGEAAQLQLVQKIAAHVDVTLTPAQAKALVEAVVNSGSRTWSGERSSLERYWSQDSEKAFAAAGGNNLNRFLGYP